MIGEPRGGPWRWTPARSGAPTAAAATLLAALSLSGAAAGGEARQEPPYLGPDGRPLSFTSDAEVEEFLRTAALAGGERQPVGLNRSRKVLLAKEGLRAHAIFRNVSLVEEGAPGDLRDSYLSEVAAYEMARLLGLEWVPPAVLREVEGSRGSLQLWIEQGMSDAARRRRGLEVPDAERFHRQLQVMHVFDNLIANRDRNPGNILLGPHGRLWLIDHTRSFGSSTALRSPDYVTGCERTVWERLRSLDRREVRRRLGPYVEEAEMGALFRRWEQLVATLEARIRQHGEGEVVFDLATL